MAIDVSELGDPVKWRAKAELLRTLRAGLELDDSNVQVWERSGNQAVADEDGELPPFWAVVTFGDDDADEGDEGAVGMTEWLVPFVVDVHLVSQPAGMSTEEYGERLKAALFNVVAGNRQLMDEEGERLALDVRIAGTFGPETERGGTDVVVGLEGEILLRHPEDDAYEVG